MPADFWGITPVKPVPQEKSFSGKGSDEVTVLEFTLTLHKLGTPESTHANELASRVGNKFGVFDEDDPRRDKSVKPIQFPPVGESVPFVTPTMVGNACMLFVMQPKDAQEQYGVDQLIAMQVAASPELLSDVMKFAGEVQNEKNSSRVAATE